MEKNNEYKEAWEGFTKAGVPTMFIGKINNYTLTWLRDQKQFYLSKTDGVEGSMIEPSNALILLLRNMDNLKIELHSIGRTANMVNWIAENILKTDISTPPAGMG